MALSLGAASTVIARPSELSANGAQTDASQPPSLAPTSAEEAYKHRQFLRSTWQKYHDSIVALGLSDESQANLLSLLVARSEEQWDAMEALTKMGPVSDQTAYAAQLQTREVETSEIRTAFGEAVADALDRAEQIAGLRRYLHGTVVADMYYAGLPLAAKQEFELATVYADVNMTIARVMKARGADREPPKKADPNAVDRMLLERSASILSAKQLPVLKESLINTEKQDKFLAELRSKRPNATLSPTPQQEAMRAGHSASDAEPAVAAPQSEEEIQIRHLAEARSMWANNHEIIQGLDIPPEREIKVLGLMVERQEAISGANLAALTMGVTNGRQIDSAGVDAHNSITSEITKLIGEEDLKAIDHGQQFEAYMSIARDQLGVDLAMAGVPLDVDQEIALARILQHVMSQPLQPFTENGHMVVDPVSHDTGLLASDSLKLDEASKVLTSAQLAALRQSLVTTEEQDNALRDESIARLQR
jgi:hypothetical protein